MYRDEELLPLNGIQHWVYCPRQWALIHIDRVWNENSLTAEGRLMHRVADNPAYRQSGTGCLTLRAVRLVSYELGLSGIADVVETDSEGRPVPVEYKHGRPKPGPEDEAQLAAQAICLEEMHNISVPKGYIYYGETRHRLEVVFTDELRELVRQTARQMQQFIVSGEMPPAAADRRKCRRCSLRDLCMPEADALPSPGQYLKTNLTDDAQTP